MGQAFNALSFDCPQPGVDIALSHLGVSAQDGADQLWARRSCAETLGELGAPAEQAAQATATEAENLAVGSGGGC